MTVNGMENIVKFPQPITRGTASLFIAESGLPPDFKNRLYTVMCMALNVWDVEVVQERGHHSPANEDIAVFHIYVKDSAPPPWNPLDQIMAESDFDTPA